MIIKKLEQCDRELYDKYAKEHGTIFNSLSWLSIFGDTVEHYGFYNKGGELIGGFFTYRETRFRLNIYRNPPYTPCMGPFLKVEASNPVSVMDLWKKTLSLLSDFLENLPYSIISYSINKNVTDMQPFIWKKYKVIPGYTYILDLSRSIDDLWQRMSNERRKNINKGKKDGLYVKKIDDYEIVKSLAIKTFLRQDKDVNEVYLSKVLFEFATNKNSYAFGTFMNDKPIACTFCVYDNNLVYYLIGGYDNESKHHGAGAMSMWETIQFAKKSGFNKFDFEGSMVPQIEKYFRGFGGQMTPYYTINKAKLPLEILLKFYKRELF